MGAGEFWTPPGHFQSAMTGVVQSRRSAAIEDALRMMEPLVSAGTYANIVRLLEQVEAGHRTITRDEFLRAVLAITERDAC